MVNQCECRECNQDTLVNGIPYALTRMILCPTCGNKRCPKATNHNLECTNSNEVGQRGSWYSDDYKKNRKEIKSKLGYSRVGLGNI